MKINKRNPYHWLLLLQQWLYTWLAIASRYLTKRPQKPVVVLYGHQLSGNLRALYVEWERAFQDEFDCHFLSLDPEYSRKLQNENIKVLQCCRLRDMSMVGHSSAMITDHGLHLMTPFITFTDIKFIDVWHGIPFKGFTPDNFRIQHRYDEVWVSSPLLKQIYTEKFGFPPEVVRDLGYARADYLFGCHDQRPIFRRQLGIPTGNKIVLYAPTWKQDDTGRELFPFGESQESFLEKIGQVCASNSATLVVRSHLNAIIAKNSIENVVYCSMRDYPDAEGLLLETDVLISDWSSICFDFLALNRPTIFLDVPPPFKNGFSLGPEYRFGDVITDMPSLIRNLGDYLASPNTWQTRHNEQTENIMREVYSTNTDGRAALRQLSHLAAIGWRDTEAAVTR